MKKHESFPDRVFLFVFIIRQLGYLPRLARSNSLVFSFSFVALFTGWTAALDDVDDIKRLLIVYS